MLLQQTQNTVKVEATKWQKHTCEHNEATKEEAHAAGDKTKLHYLGSVWQKKQTVGGNQWRVEGKTARENIVLI